MKKLLFIPITLLVACVPPKEQYDRVKTYALHQVGTEVYIKPDSTKGVIIDVEPKFNNSCGCGGDTTYTFKYTVRTKNGQEEIIQELIY